MRPCECGCGETLASSNPKTRFLPGHYTIWLAKNGTPRRPKYVPTPKEIPSGLCECGCGKPTQIRPPSARTYRAKRLFAGHPTPRLPGHGISPNERRARAWRGGRCLNVHGYVLVYAPDHPHAHKGYVLEHRLVMEAQIGRLLTSDEAVHHKNHDKTDNHPENLALMSVAEHQRHHRAEMRQLGIRQKGTPRRGIKHAKRRGITHSQ